MKFSRQPERLVRPKAAEAAGQLEETQVSLFDPEKDIPVELFERNAKILAGSQPTPAMQVAIFSSAWYGAINSGYREQMRASPWCKQAWMKQLKDSLQAARLPGRVVGAQRNAVRGCIEQMASIVQIFPDSKTQIPVGLPSLYNWILKQYDPDTEPLDFDILADILKIWPEKKQAVMKLFFPDGIPTQMKAPTTKWDLSAQLLVLPELRPQAKVYLEKRKASYAQELRFWVGQSVNEGDVPPYHAYLRNLAILSADSAWIDEVGREHIEFATKPVSQPTPLPPRFVM